MNPNRRFVAIALSALLAFSIVGPGLALADADSLTGSPSLNVAQNGEIVVTVTDDNATVENATVNVTVDDENVTYAGAGTYTTDGNGTVGLPVPEETVNVTINATVENRTAETSVTLAAETDDEAEDLPFGHRVSAFLQALFGADDGDDRSVGERVAGFVTSNNPGNPPAHAGPGSVTGSSELNESNGSDSSGDAENDIEMSGDPSTDRGNGGGPPAAAPGHSNSGSESGGGDANSGNSVGDSGETSGNSGNAPGNSGNGGGNPGNGGNAPGR